MTGPMAPTTVQSADLWINRKWFIKREAVGDKKAEYPRCFSVRLI